MTRLTGKSSVIFVGTKEGVRSYDSYGKMPAALQKQLASTFHKENTVTILIADKQGREELRRVLQARSSLGDRQPSVVPSRAADQRNAAAISFRTWLALLFPTAIAAALWFLIGS
jgi:hypothetical protein